MKASDKYTVETITEIRTWASNLFSFKTIVRTVFEGVVGRVAAPGQVRIG